MSTSSVPSRINGVDVAKMKNVNTTDVAVDWETIYDVDLTAQTTGTSWPRILTGSNGEEVSWDAGNVATYSSEVSVQNGTGVRIIIDGASTTSGRWFGNTQTGPCVYAPIANVFTAAGLTYTLDDTVAIQTIHEFTVNTAGTDSSYFYGGLLFFDGTTGEPTPGGASAGNWVHSCWLTTSSVGDINQWFFRNGTCHITDPAGAGNQYWIDESAPPTSQPHTFAEIVAYPGSVWSSRAGPNTTFPTPLTVTDSYAYGSLSQELGPEMGTNGAPWENTTANPGQTTQFAFTPDGAATSHQANFAMFSSYFTNTTRDSKITCVWKKLRVLRRGT